VSTVSQEPAATLDAVVDDLAPARAGDVPPAPDRSRPLTGLRQRAIAFTSTTGEIGVFTGRVLSRVFLPPYSYGSEFVSQMVFVLRSCWFPMIVGAVCFSFGPAGIQAANFLSMFGALDRLGGVFVVVVVREFAPLVAAIVMAGAAGTAMCADLGSRRIREEVDALMVLGVDPIKSLVAPRFLALVVATGLFTVFGLVFGTIGGVLVSLVNHAPLGPFWATFFNNATSIELWGSELKGFGYGAIIAVICCYKGLTASGGPAGVGRAVNQAVVIAFIGIGVFDFVFTQVLLATHPVLVTPR
jgi:phospholipid/cholesterol/gamma-HCH transport system permease protein